MWPAMAVLVPALIISAIVLLVLASDIQSGNLWIRIMIALIPITAVTVVLCLFASDIAGKHEQEKMYRFVRRVLGVYLVTTPNCGNCEYSLLGLPVEAEKATGRLRVVCPECGAANIPPRQQLVPAEESA